MVFKTPPTGPQELGALSRIEGVWDTVRAYVAAEPRRWVGPLRRILAAKAVQGSNSIEGYDVSVEDAVAAIEGESPTEASHESWLAVTGYQRAMTYVLVLARDPHFDYTSALIRGLHFMMAEYDMKASPGLWRPGPVSVRNDASREIVYSAPSENLVDELVEELIGELQSEEECPALIRAAMAHLNLVMIHPFRDGNGRMARCLQTLVLTREGILAREFCSIEEYLGSNTTSYYDILAEVGGGHWSPRRDARPWVRYCLTAHFVQAASVLRRVRYSERVWTECEQLISTYRLPERMLAVMFDATYGLRIRNASYRATLEAWEEPISNQVATNDLTALVNAGFLKKQGAKRGTFYVSGEPLASIREELRKSRTAISVDGLFDPIVDAEDDAHPFEL